MGIQYQSEVDKKYHVFHGISFLFHPRGLVSYGKEIYAVVEATVLLTLIIHLFLISLVL